jgi:hypothetical protein
VQDSLGSTAAKRTLNSSKARRATPDLGIVIELWVGYLMEVCGSWQCPTFDGKENLAVGTISVLRGGRGKTGSFAYKTKIRVCAIYVKSMECEEILSRFPLPISASAPSMFGFISITRVKDFDENP